METLSDPESAAAVTTGRVFLEALSGGCQVPSGALGVPYDTTRRPCGGYVGSPDGSLTDPDDLGRRLADLLRERGGAEGSWMSSVGGRRVI